MPSIRCDIHDLPPPLVESMTAATQGKPPSGFAVAQVGAWGAKFAGMVVGFVAGPIMLALFVHRNVKVGQWLSPDNAVLLTGPVIVSMVLAIACLRLLWLRRHPLADSIVVTPDVVLRVGIDGRSVTIHSFSDLPYDLKQALTSTLSQVLKENESARSGASPEPWLQNLASRKAPLNLGRSLAAAARVVVAAVITGILVTATAYALNLRLLEQSLWRSAEANGTYEGYAEYLNGLPKERLPALASAVTAVEVRRPLAEARRDDLLFQDAVASRNPWSLRAYRRRMPGGRHLAEVDSAITAIYDEAERIYLDKAKEDKRKPEVIDAMRGLFKYARSSANPKLHVAFMPVKGLDGHQIEKAIAALTGSRKVVPVEPAFTAEKNRARETSFQDALAGMLGSLYGGHLITVTDEPAVKGEPRVLIQYEVKPSGSVYQLKDDDTKPASKRPLFPGILMNLEATLQIPSPDALPPDDMASGLRIGFNAKPDSEITVRSEADAAMVYNRMADNAFRDFLTSLKFAYGLLGPIEPPGMHIGPFSARDETARYGYREP